MKELIVTHIKRQSRECVQLFLEPSESDQDQFYNFIPGQYLTLETSINGQSVRRSYSICSSPDHEKLSVGIKQIPEGLFSTFANQQLKVGDTLSSLPPDGQFLKSIEEIKGKNLFLIAAGSGITPMLSIITHHLENNPSAKVCLLFGNRSSKSVIFKDELEDLKNRFVDRFQIFYFLSKERQLSDLFYGRINPEKLDQLFNLLINKDDFHHYFLCGPEQMILSCKSYLESEGIDKDKIHFELFYAESQDGAKKKVQLSQKVGENNIMEIIQFGQRYTLELGEDFSNILDEAAELGLDLPYACKGGVCCTCKAKIDEGTAKMFVNYALEDEEVEQGYVLTCQAYPTSKKLVVNYDKAL